MELICEAVRAQLQRAGIAAQRVLLPAAARRLRQPVAAVGMKRWALEGRPTYLGLWQQLELFSHRMEGELELRVHAETSARAEQLAAQAAAVLLEGVEGLTLQQVELCQPVYDPALDCFVCPVTAKVGAWLYAAPRDDGLYFEDFALRGQLKSARRQEEGT